MNIKIIAIPNGEAPLWVRQQWVGLILPIAENLPSDAVEVGVLGRKLENSTTTRGYPVETWIAVEKLKIKSVQAGIWWNTHVSKLSIPWLTFPKEICLLTDSFLSFGELSKSFAEVTIRVAEKGYKGEN